MIALDTNVLMRLLVADDLKQQDLAAQLLRKAAEQGEPCLVSDPVLCETEQVLESCYRASRADILLAFEGLLAQVDVLVFEDREAFCKALDAYRRGRANFSDLMIGAKAAAQGARTTFTFDRGLARQEGFSLLG